MSIFYRLVHQHGLFFFIQHPKGNNANKHRNQRAGSSCQPHWQQTARVQLRGYINPRHPHTNNGNNVVHKRKAGFLAGAKIAAKAKVDPGKNAVPHIAPQILPAGGRHGFRGGKQPPFALQKTA